MSKDPEGIFPEFLYAIPDKEVVFSVGEKMEDVVPRDGEGHVVAAYELVRLYSAEHQPMSCRRLDKEEGGV